MRASVDTCYCSISLSINSSTAARVRRWVHMTALRRYMVILIVARAERIHRHNLARAKTPEQIEKLNNAREIRTIWGERAANLTPEEREYLAREAQIAIAVQRMRPPPAPKPVGAPGTEAAPAAAAALVATPAAPAAPTAPTVPVAATPAGQANGAALRSARGDGGSSPSKSRPPTRGSRGPRRRRGW